MPTYLAILDNTLFMCHDQLSDSSIITPRNLASCFRSILILEIIKGVESSVLFDLEYIIYLVFLRFNAMPLDLTHFTRIL